VFSAVPFLADDHGPQGGFGHCGGDERQRGAAQQEAPCCCSKPNRPVVALGFTIALLGFAVLLPLIGHATWHAYQEAIDASIWPQNEAS